MSLAPGVRLGPYEVLALLGAGGMGEVYKARDTRLDRTVAIKILPAHIAADSNRRQRFEREARAVAALNHPHICTLHDVGHQDGTDFLVMEYLEGQTLAERLRKGALPLDQALQYAIQIAEGLDAAHRRGIVHRDLKPSNIMITKSGAKLLDFGIASILPTGITDGSASREQTITVEGTIVGTLNYMAPEQLEGRQADTRADIWAFGAMVYEMLTGRRAFGGEMESRVIAAVLDSEPAPIATSQPLAPPQLERLVGRCLAKDPDERWQTASDIFRELRGTVEDISAKPAKVAKTVTTRRGKLRAVEGLMVGILAGILTTIFMLANRRNIGVDQTESSRTVIGMAPAEQLNERPIVDGRLDQRGIARNIQPEAPSGQMATPVSQPEDASLRALQFQARDWVLITAFENRTGETVLDGTLEFALERELSNSAFVNVVPRERIEDVLRLMRKPVDTKVDARLGREVAVRDGGIRALVTGRVEKIGGSYLISSQIVSPAEGLVATSLSEEASIESQLLPAVRRQAFRVREALGEMLSTIRKSENALEKVTTPSLPALRLYSQADSLIRQGKPAAAEELLKDTINEDTDFASAHILLAWTIHNQGRPSTAYLPDAERAVKLAERASSVERYFILGSYYGMLADAAGSGAEAVGHRRRAAGAYETLLHLKPDHYWGTGNLYSTYQALGREPETTEMSVRIAQLRSQSVLSQIRAAERSLWSGDLRRAHMYVERAKGLYDVQPEDTGTPGRQADDRRAHVFAFDAYEPWLRSDVSSVRRVADDLRRSFESNKKGDLSSRPLPTILPSIYVGLGRFGDAEKIAQQLIPQDPRNRFVYGVMRLEAIFGNRHVIEPLRGLLEFADPKAFPVNAFTISDLIRFGMLDQARYVVALAKQGQSKPPVFHLPEIEGHLALAEGRLGEGVRMFEAISGAGGALSSDVLRMAWTIADAWKGRGDFPAAIKVLEDATGNVRMWRACVTDYYYGVASWIHARDELAELYVATGRAEDAEAIDDELLKLLAVADADHPVLGRIKGRQQKR